MGTVILGTSQLHGERTRTDVNVICLLILGLFFVLLVTALAGPVVAGVSDVGLWLYGLRKGRAEMRRAQAEAFRSRSSGSSGRSRSGSGSVGSGGGDSPS